MQKVTKPTHAYIARRSCGCVVGVVTDYQDKSTGEAVGEWIADGLAIERVDWNTYRNKIANEKTFLSCPHGQLTLPIPSKSGGGG